MATLSLGPLIDGIRGSIGGTTFGRAINGPTARRKPRPLISPPPAPPSLRNALTYAATTWRTMTTLFQSYWAAYALTVTFYDSLGHSYHPTAENAFIRNCIWDYLDDGFFTNPARPSADGLPTGKVLTMDYSAHNIRWTASDPATATGDHFIFAVFRAGSRIAHNTQLRFCSTKAQHPISYPFTLATNIDSGLTVGQLLRVHVLWRHQDNDSRLSTLNHQYVDFTST